MKIKTTSTILRQGKFCEIKKDILCRLEFIFTNHGCARYVLFIALFIAGVFSVNINYAAEPELQKEVCENSSGEKIMTYKLSENEELIYNHPRRLNWIKAIPRDYKSFFKNTFRKDQVLNIGLIAGGTMLLYAYDEQIISNAKNFGRVTNIPGTSNQTALIDQRVKIGKQELALQFNVPTDLNSSMYFLGDGWTHTSIALSFWITGLITKDYRALQTASQLGECILTTGIATQFLKHITGRESPFTTTTPRGLWHFFPNQKEYAAHVPSHDAFPSGHLATAMATVTVIAENYPEKRYIRPVGYTLMGMLGFAMLNNGVHWASDYPLGIALGYSFAKIAVAQGREVRKTNSDSTINSNHFKLKPLLYPSIQPGGAGLGVVFVVRK
jgi:membrane-associated phospholipid phosphatase